jgi:predicted dehydrogenase
MKPTRRQLLHGSMAALTAASWARVAGANDRVGIALVGCGNRGRALMKVLLAHGKADLRGLCDVWDERRAQAKAELSAPASVLQTAAMEEILAQPGTDAVMISTPDHLHVPQALLALGGRKHLYLEKPILHRLAERDALIRAASKSDRVLMSGTQQRSGEHYRRAREEIFARGRLGDVVFARSFWTDFGRQRRTLVDTAKPPGLDWPRFIGTTPRVPYSLSRYETWRYFPEYGGGLIADIFSHWADVAQWMMDDARPEKAIAFGGQYRFKDGRRNPDTVNAIVKYAKWNLTFESTVLPIRPNRPSVLFEGSQGTLDLARDGYVFTPNEGSPEIVRATEDLDSAHTAAFLDAVQGKKPPPSLATSLQACIPVQMALASYWQGGATRMSDDGRTIVAVKNKIQSAIR